LVARLVRSRRQTEPLRTLREEEEGWLRRLARATREPATHMIRAKQLLAVAGGQSYTQAARETGRRSGDAVAQLVSRFKREGVQALERRGGAGSKPTYGTAEREQILAVVRRGPEPEAEGRATWSLTLLPRALHRQAPPSLGRSSTYTIWAVLHEAGLPWGRARSWCETGHARRNRKSGGVTVGDPEAAAKKR
jgi:transposase